MIFEQSYQKCFGGILFLEKRESEKESRMDRRIENKCDSSGIFIFPVIKARNIKLESS